MPVTDVFKRVLPKVGATKAASDGPANIQTAFANFSNSLHAVVPTADETERNQIRSSAPADGFPLFVWDADDKMLYVSEQRSSPWIPVGGKPAGVQMNLQNASVPSGQLTRVKFGSFIAVSDGWTVSSDGYSLTVPETGVYVIWIRITMPGAAGGTRAFSEITVNNSMMTREPGYADDNFTVNMTRPLTKGNQIGFRVAQNAGSTITSTNGELVAVRIATPNWTVA